MFTDSRGPIESFNWGRYVINGVIHSMDGEGVGKDICILNGEVHAWQERKGHNLKPDMVECVLHGGVSVLVIGNGVNGALKVPGRTRRAIKAAGIEDLVILETPAACAAYNELAREGKPVALLAHGTC
jgi:hypothetical protein